MKFHIDCLPKYRHRVFVDVGSFKQGTPFRNTFLTLSITSAPKKFGNWPDRLMDLRAKRKGR